MLEVSNGRISLTRGDTATFNVEITTEKGKPYEIQKDDILRLTVKVNAIDSKYVIQKTVTGSNIFHITPEDTSSLAFQTYRYDVELTTASGNKYTVITPHAFDILEEVTY